MRVFTCILGMVVVVLVGGAPAGAQEGLLAEPAGDIDCLTPEFLSLSLVDCGGPAITTSPEPTSSDAASEALAGAAASDELVFPPYCRLKVDVVIWGGRFPDAIARAIDQDYSECAEYSVSVPPRQGTDIGSPERYEAIRALNPRIHPLPEIRWESWKQFVISTGRTFYEGGVEARRRMAARGIDVTRGETWAFNELTEDVLEDAPGARAEVLEFLRGLYDGQPGMPKARGVVFNIGKPSNAGLAELTEHKATLQAWLTDEAFWRELDLYVDFFADEVYASSLNWGVEGVPLAKRAASLNDFFHHTSILAEAGPESAAAARMFLRRTFVPLANAAWPHPGIGETHLLSAGTMSHFVSTQVYALRHYANAHPRTGPGGRMGFAWAPNPADPGYSPEGQGQVADRLASAIHESSEEGTNSQRGACGPPGEHVWCGGAVEGAELNDAWEIFALWEEDAE